MHQEAVVVAGVAERHVHLPLGVAGLNFRTKSLRDYTSRVF